MPSKDSEGTPVGRAGKQRQAAGSFVNQGTCLLSILGTAAAFKGVLLNSPPKRATSESLKLVNVAKGILHM